MSYTIKHNTPQAGCIQWAELSIQYEGQTHAITDGYTNSIYAYWTPKYPNNLVVTNEYPTLTADDCLVFLNKSGTALVVPGATGLDGGLIVPGTILADALAANSVTADAIAAGSVTANAIAAYSISSNLIAANAIGTAKLAAGAVTADKIVSDAITADKIAANAVTSTKIASNAITATKIKAGEITSEKIASNAITAVKIAATAITADKLSTDAIKSKNYTQNVKGTFINLEDGTIDSKNLKVKSNGDVDITGNINASRMRAKESYSIYCEDDNSDINIITASGWNKNDETDKQVIFGIDTTKNQSTWGLPYILMQKVNDAMTPNYSTISMNAQKMTMNIMKDLFIYAADKVNIKSILDVEGEIRQNGIPLTNGGIGYSKLPDGTMMQWGMVRENIVTNAYKNTAKSITFPHMFGGGCPVTVNVQYENSSYSGVPWVDYIDYGSCRVVLQGAAAANTSTATYFRWMAIGRWY